MPDDAVGVDIKNQAAFTACLDAIRKSIDEPDTALNAAGRELVTAAAAAAPKATGRLAGAHRLLPAAGRAIRIVADTPYAAVVHWGWPGHGIRRQPWLIATWLRNPQPLEKASSSLQSSIDKATSKT
jgi:hypothetical protein